MHTLCDPEIKQKYDALATREQLLPVKTTDFYLQKVAEETEAIGKGGPLYRTVFPTAERLELVLENEGRDYINEKSYMPVDGVSYIMQKYRNRVAFLVTETCFAHCQYCFRAYKLCEDKNTESVRLKEKLSVLIRYLEHNSDVEEIILTGGDPLVIGEDTLLYLVKQLAAWKLRIHTRAVVYQPSVITSTLIKQLAHQQVRVVLHINHPYEICNVVQKKIKLMVKYGLKLYAQYPLLRGINDSFAVQKQLLETLDNLCIRPLSIFITEPNKYCAAFRLSFKRIETIIDAVNWQTSSWINSVRFALDTQIGKVRRENIVMRDKNKIVFQRDGKTISYWDFPENFDHAGDDSILLWRTAQ